jgi:hypothetical protein
MMLDLMRLLPFDQSTGTGKTRVGAPFTAVSAGPRGF